MSAKYKVGDSVITCNLTNPGPEQLDLSINGEMLDNEGHTFTVIEVVSGTFFDFKYYRLSDSWFYAESSLRPAQEQTAQSKKWRFRDFKVQ